MITSIHIPLARTHSCCSNLIAKYTGECSLPCQEEGNRIGEHLAGLCHRLPIWKSFSLLLSHIGHTYQGGQLKPHPVSVSCLKLRNPGVRQPFPSTPHVGFLSLAIDEIRRKLYASPFPSPARTKNTRMGQGWDNHSKHPFRKGKSGDTVQKAIWSNSVTC